MEDTADRFQDGPTPRAEVVDINGERVGGILAAYPGGIVVIATDTSPAIAYRVPSEAITNDDGNTIILNVPKGALAPMSPAEATGAGVSRGAEGSESSGYGTVDTDADVGQPGPPVTREPRGEPLPDERICQDVRDRLTQHVETRAPGIQISVVNGEVTLEGSVGSPRAKDLAQDVAGAVAGVSEVRNLLHIAEDRDRDQAQ